MERLLAIPVDTLGISIESMEDPCRQIFSTHESPCSFVSVEIVKYASLIPNFLVPGFPFLRTKNWFFSFSAFLKLGYNKQDSGNIAHRLESPSPSVQSLIFSSATRLTDPSPAR